MRFLSLSQFLNMFSDVPEHLNTLGKFRKNAKVKTSRGIVSLTSYLADKSVFAKDIQFELGFHRQEAQKVNWLKLQLLLVLADQFHPTL